VFPAGEFWLDAQSVETEVPVGASADEDLIDILAVISALLANGRNFLVKAVDES